MDIKGKESKQLMTGGSREIWGPLVALSGIAGLATISLIC